MIQIKFGNYRSYDDLELILTSKTIGAAEVKENKISTQSMHGDIDLTDFFGEVKYNNRPLEFVFSTIVTPSTFLTKYSEIQNKLHGQKMNIIIDDDTTHYYRGRCSVSAFTNDKNVGNISISCDCEPFKYDVSETVITNDVTTSATITLVNTRMKVVPTITTTAAFTIVFGSNSWSVNAGTFTLPELELSEGNNTVTVTGTGTITFTYRKGGL